MGLGSNLMLPSSSLLETLSTLLVLLISSSGLLLLSHSHTLLGSSRMRSLLLTWIELLSLLVYLLLLCLDSLHMLLLN